MSAKGRDILIVTECLPQESARMSVCFCVCIYLCDRLRPSGNEEALQNVNAARLHCEIIYNWLREQNKFSINKC